MEGSHLSFIPKKSLTAPVSRESGLSFVLTLSLIIFGVSLLSYGGVFFYKDTLKKSIMAKEQELEKRKQDLDPVTIRGINEISGRIEALKNILAKHRSLLDFFEFLSVNTLKSVRFTSFNYSDSEESPVVNLQGVARSYGAISLLAEKFYENPNIKGIIFSGFGLKDGGNVSFSAKIIADDQMFSYRPNITRGSQ